MKPQPSQNGITEFMNACSRRGPGMNVRVVTIADDFPAKAELETLLGAYARAWPGIADDVKTGFEKIGFLHPRTKTHLKIRGLWPY